MTETGRNDPLERLRWLSAVDDPAHNVMLLAKVEVRTLLAVVEAAQELDDNWEAVNRCYTLGHPYSQNLRRALAALPSQASDEDLYDSTYNDYERDEGKA
jgi:hypothetical protein